MDIHFLDNMDIADITSELRDPAKYHGYLRTMAHFSSYGWRNIYRIYKQMPHASKLTDFKNRRFGIDIGNSDRNQYGYTRPELLPLTKNRAITFFLHGVTIYLLHKNNTEAMAHDGRRKQFHRAQRSGDCPY